MELLHLLRLANYFPEIRLDGDGPRLVPQPRSPRLSAKADAVVIVLEAKGLPPTAEQQARIEASGAEVFLDGLLRRAARATSVDEIFEE